MTSPDPNYFSKGPGILPVPDKRANQWCKCGHSWGAHFGALGCCQGWATFDTKRCQCKKFRRKRRLRRSTK